MGARDEEVEQDKLIVKKPLREEFGFDVVNEGEDDETVVEGIDDFDWKEALRQGLGDESVGIQGEHSPWEKLKDLTKEENNENWHIIDKRVGLRNLSELEDIGSNADKYFMEVSLRREDNSFLDRDNYLCIVVESLGYFKSDESKRVQTFSEITKEYVEERGLDPDLDVVVRVDNKFYKPDSLGEVEEFISFFVMSRSDYLKLWNKISDNPQVLISFLKEQGFDTDNGNFLTGNAVRMIEYGDNVIKDQSKSFDIKIRKTLKDKILSEKNAVDVRGAVAPIVYSELPIEDEKLKEPKQYDEMFEDLFLVNTSEEPDIISGAKQRLEEHGIRLKNHSRDQDRENYLSKLTRIHNREGSDEDIEILKKSIWSGHNKARKGGEGELPNELKNKEKEVVNKEPVYFYIQRPDGLVADLRTVYEPMPRSENERLAVSLRKTESYERIKGFGIKRINREDRGDYIDSDRGNLFLDLLNQYLSTPDDKVDEFKDLNVLMELASKSGIRNFSQIELARRKNVNGNIKVPEKNLISEEQRQAEQKEKELAEYLKSNFFPDLIKATWGNVKVGPENVDTAKERLANHGIDIESDYVGLVNEAISAIKHNLAVLVDHFSGKKTLEEQELQRIEGEILSALGIDNSIFADSNGANETMVKKEDGGVLKTETLEDIEKEKYLEYLGGEFLKDLEVVYPRKGATFTKAVRDKSNKNYTEVCNFVKVTYILPANHTYAGKPAAEYKVRDMLIDFFKLESGLPRSWDPELLKKMVGGDEKRLEEIKEDLEEARKQKLERDKGKVQGGGEKGEIKGEGEKEMKKELVFDEKEMLREFGEFVKLNGGRTDVWNKWLKDLDKVNEQKKREVIGQLKYTWDLLKNRELRLNDQHFPFWQKYAIAYLRSLGVVGKV